MNDAPRTFQSEIKRVPALAWIGLIIAVAVLSAAGGYWFARHGGGPADLTHSATQSSSAAAGSSDRPVLYWYDPMVPNQHFDKPGKSPFMDMQLVPKYSDEAAGAGGVRVSSNAVQNLGIRLGRVERIALTSRLRAVGSVVFDERLL